MHADRIKAQVARVLGLELVDDDALTAAVKQRVAELRLPSSEHYLAALDDPREIHALGELLTVGETYFFRMRSHLDVLRNLVATIEGRSPIVLSAGCSTGEEAYSIAITLRGAGQPDARVVGIDLNQRSLDLARAATYADWSLRNVPVADRTRFFTPAGKRWEVRPEIREMVELRSGNLLDDGAIPLGPFDAIFCRNVIMYFTREAARTVVARLTASLRSDGLLFLGHAETLRGLSDEYGVQQHADLFHYRHRRESPPPPPPPPPAPVPAAAPEISIERAMTLLDRSELSAAEEICTTLIRREQSIAEAHYILGLAAETRGDRPAAIDRHRAVLYLEPNFALAHLQLGRLERREGEVERARRDLLHALELLTHEKASRLERFGGGFDREGLIALGRAELAAL